MENTEALKQAKNKTKAAEKEAKALEKLNKAADNKGKPLRATALILNLRASQPSLCKCLPCQDALTTL